MQLDAKHMSGTIAIVIGGLAALAANLLWRGYTRQSQSG